MTRAHGTRKRYVDGPDEHDEDGKGCRCTRCKQANSAFKAKWARSEAERKWSGEPAMVDADPVRQHVHALMAAGAGLVAIIDRAGVGEATMTALLYGHGGYPPTVRMFPATARKILAVRADQAQRPRVKIDATGTHRRIQALVALGWPISEQGRRIGRQVRNMSQLLRAERVTVATADRVRGLYSELSMTPAPDSLVARRARCWAEANGWLPPLAWDDELIDLPDAVADRGEATPKEEALFQNAEELVQGQGYTAERAAERLGVSPGYLRRVLSERRLKLVEAQS